MPQIRARYVGHRPNDPAIRAFIRQAGDLDARSARVLTAARQQVGVRSGTLLASLRREFGEGSNGPYVDVKVGVGGLTPYLQWHMYGSEPHEIRPRRRKALRWVGPSGVVFAGRVMHPGHPGNPFLTEALRSAR